MKLLLCLSCHSIFNLTKRMKKCSCKKSKGRYINNIDAQIYGNCIPLGFANNSFREALSLQTGLGDRQDGWGRRFEAFIIPEQTESVKHFKEIT